MDAARASALLDRLPEAQNAFHGGGDVALRDLLTPVPGDRMAACRLPALDPVAFDTIWTP